MVSFAIEVWNELTPEQGVSALTRGNDTGERRNQIPRPVELFAMGIAGLDDILGGGLARDHLYLIEGDPAREKPPSPCSF